MGTRTSVALFVFMTIGIAISAPGSTASTAEATLPAAQTKGSGICAANPGSKCVYVAANGLDTNAGTFTAPYRTFLPAMKRAKPGDIIYARGGTYGAQNTTAFAVQIAAKNPTCPGDQPSGPAPNTCYSILTAYIPILDFKGWTSKIPGYGVPNGSAGKPITVRSYPNERPVFNRGSKAAIAVAVSNKWYWVVDGFELVGETVTIYGGGGPRLTNTHDITIRNNEIHDVTISGGGNPGLVRIDRANDGGAYNIFIENNKLHDLYDIAHPGVWKDTPDMQHFGAVTTISVTDYNQTGRPGFGAFDLGGTGSITISGNEIWNVPQVFFFKNTSPGPISINNNVMRDANRMGIIAGSNVTFENNLTYDIPGPFLLGSYQKWSDPRMSQLDGRNNVFRNNTFVGMAGFYLRSDTRSNRFERNVFYGMSARVAGAGYNTPSYLTVAKELVASDQPRLEFSVSDNNCFVTPYSDFLFVTRRLDTSIEYSDIAQARQRFSIDKNSTVVIESDQTSFFVDPKLRNYSMRNPAVCGATCKGANCSGTPAAPLTNRNR